MFSIYQIKDAYKLIRGNINKTPILFSDKINNLTKSNIIFKAENLQKTGSFKIRGALNFIGQSKNQDFVAPSSGNHAQGVAAAASLHNKNSTLVMPSDAPLSKIQGVKSYGGNIIFYDRYKEDRVKIAKKISLEKGYDFIPPYDHKDIILGQGTLGLEVIDQLKDINFVPDTVLCCCGGGGLISGLSIALKSYWDNLNIHPVEPEFWDDTRISLKEKKRHIIINKKSSICDALLSETPGELTFRINKKLLSFGISVTDQQAMEAIHVAYEYLKLVLEPGGAVALAAALNYSEVVKNKNVLVILSGGNIDKKIFLNSLKTKIKKL